jgi:protein TonB
VVFFVHRGAVNVSGAIPQVASQLSNSGQQPVNDAPSPAGLHKGETSQAPAQSRSSSQNPAQPVAPEQPQPLAAVASVPATATGPTTTDVRIESMPAQSNVRRQEKSPVAAKQPEVPAARRPVIPSLKLGSPSAPKQILANSSEGAAPLTDISSADAGGGSSTDGLLTSAGRTSNPPAPPAAPAPTPIPVPKILRDPEVITTMRPVYPPTARQSNIQGTVTVSASIDENGNVVSSKAVSGPILLRQAAADAVKQWKYSPRLVDGKPAPSQVTVNVEFKLK